MTTAEDPLADFGRAADMVIGLVADVPAGRWGAPTACADWDARGIVNHLAYGNAKVAHWTGVGPPVEDGDFLGDGDILPAFTGSVHRVREVLATPGLLERMVTTPLGEAPGTFLVHMRVNEYLAHGWDLADATGRPTDLLPDLAERALAQWQARFGERGRQPGGPFGPPQEAPPGSTAADRLAAFLGRKGRSW